MTKKPSKDEKQKQDFENIGKMMVNIYETGYLNANQSYKMAFLKGIVSGVGGVIGATLVVAFIIWLLSIFESVPLIGPFIDNINDTIQKAKR